jgi:ABC-type lipoprotein export system ATPase subunit
MGTIQLPWERSILLVTHDSRISSYADRILQMMYGRITEETRNQKEDRHA